MVCKLLRKNFDLKISKNHYLKKKIWIIQKNLENLQKYIQKNYKNLNQIMNLDKFSFQVISFTPNRPQK